MAKKSAKKAVKKTTSKKVVKKPKQEVVQNKEECKTKPCRRKIKWGFILSAIVVAVILIFIFGGNKMDDVKEGSKVKLHYTGTLEDGTVFDSSVDKEPLEFVIGTKQVIPGFEEGVKGLKKGDKKTIKIPADKAYGQRDETRVAEYPKDQIPADMQKVEVGNQVLFQNTDGSVAIATVKEIKEDVLVMDLNHPLAGKDLKFEVEILDVDNSGVE